MQVEGQNLLDSLKCLDRRLIVLPLECYRVLLQRVRVKQNKKTKMNTKGWGLGLFKIVVVDLKGIVLPEMSILSSSNQTHDVLKP